MKYTEALNRVRSCMDADIPVLLMGPPGCGKSALVAEAATSSNRTMYDVRLTSLEPPDLTGLPQFSKSGACTYARPDTLPPLEDTNAVLFLDELLAARREMQPIAYQLVYDRRVGSHRLPDNCRVVAASNRVSDNAISERMSTALASRLAHYTVDPDATSTARYFLSRKLDPRMAAFLMWRPSLISTYKSDSGEAAFGCPRTWEMSARMLPFAEDHETHAGIVGAGQAAQLMAFLRLGDKLPPISDCLNRPMHTKVFTEPDLAYAMVCALGSAITPANADSAMQYLLRYPSAEYTVLGADVAVSVQQDNGVKLMRSPGWARYCADNRVTAAMGVAA